MSTCYLTTQGRILLAKMLATDRLLYTRAVTSSTVVESPELLNALPSEQQSADFFTYEQLGDTCRLTVQFSCAALQQSYQLKMLGIYAKSEADQQEILYKVIVYATDEERISLPAGEDITYKFVITDSITEGELAVQVVDDLAAPVEHVYNPYRHLFTQTNSSTSTAVVDCGDRNTFADGQRIVFVPRASLSSSNAKISCAGVTFRLKCTDLAGNGLTYAFVPNQSYVLTYRASDNSFVYVKHNEIEVKNGVAHYWTGAAWKTVIEAGRITASMSASAPAGTLLCNGQALAKATYPELYAVLGDSYGEAEAGYFKLPDLRDRFLLAAKNSSHPLGSSGGSSSHTLTANNMPAHDHPFSATQSLSHTHSINISLSKEADHRHKNGVCDDETTIFWEPYGGAATLSTTFGHRAMRADDEATMGPPIYTGYTSPEGGHTHTATASIGAKSQSFAINGTTGKAGKNSPTAINHLPPFFAVYYYIYTGKPLL